MDMIGKARAGLTFCADKVQTNSPLILGQNAPNPFNNKTTISYYLPLAGFAKMSVYNMAGQLIATPVNGDMKQGNYQVSFNAGDLPCGSYFYRLQTVTGTECKQMEIVRVDYS